jgi:hypothetical protein
MDETEDLEGKESRLIDEQRAQLSRERDSLDAYRQLAQTAEPLSVKPVSDTPDPKKMLYPNQLAPTGQEDPTLKALTGVLQSAPGEYADIKERRQEILKRYSPLLEENRKAIEAEIARQQGLTREAPPSTARPPAPTRQQFIDPTVAKGMFFAASLIAGLGALGGRGRGMLAMSAMRGALQGYNEGNILKYNEGLETWKAQVNEQARAYDEYYKNQMLTLQDNRLSLEEKIRMYELNATRESDELGKVAADRKSIDDMIKNATNFAKLAGNLQNYTGTANLGKMTSTQLKEFATIRAQGGMTGIPLIDAMNPQNAAIIAGLQPKPSAGSAGMDKVFGIAIDQIPTVEPGEKNEGFLNMLPPARRQLVRDMAEGRLPVSGFGGLKVDERNELLKAAQIYAPGSSAAQRFVTGMKALNELTPGGPVGTNVLAINTMVHHIDQFAENFSKLNNSQVQKWNEQKNKLAAQFGDPALGVVQQSAMRVADEYARIIKGGRASPTESDMRLWEAIFTTNMSPGQMKANVWDALKGAGGRLAAIQDAYAEFPDQTAKMLSPETRKIIAKYKPKNASVPSWLSLSAGQRTTPQQGGGGGGPFVGKARPGEIPVIRRSDGQPGFIMERDYNPDVYDKAPVQEQEAPHHVMRGYDY